MSHRSFNSFRRVAAKAKAEKEADLALFHRIMSAEPQALYDECAACKLPTESLTIDEVRRLLLTHLRGQRPSG